MTKTIQDKIKEYAAGLVFAVSDEELIPQYEQLLKAFENNPADFAIYHATVSHIYEYTPVREVVEIIEAEIGGLNRFLSTINPLSGIDWPYLKKQKDLLINLQSRDCVTNEESDMMEGLLHLFDYFQDFAVDTMEMPEKEIFNV